MKTAKLLKKAITITALPLLLSLAPALGGCGGAGVSSVAQGQRYESGDPTYDEFFRQVHELSVQLSVAPKAESQLRMALGKELGVEPEDDDEPAAPVAATTPAPTSMDGTPAAPSPTDAYEAQLKQSAINAIPGASTVNAISAQVDQAKQTVGQFKALFGGGSAQSPQPAAAKPAAKPVKKAPKAPSASLVAKAVKTRAKKLDFEMKLTIVDAKEAKTRMLTHGESADGVKLAKAVEETAQGELELVAKMQTAKKKLEKLASLGAALEANADVTFRKSRAKQSEVKKNLADAKALIELMETRANDVSKKAELMVAKLEQAAAAELAEPAQSETSAVAQAEVKAAPAKAEAPRAEPEKKAKSEEPEKKAKPKPQPQPQRARATAPKTAMADFEP